MKNIKVEEVFDPQHMLSIVVSQDESLADLIAKFAHDNKLRGIFLVDSQSRFVGVITHGDLLRWAELRLGKRREESWVRVGELFRLVSATKAKDFARGDWRTLGVKLDDSLGKALYQMITAGEIDIPVLDDQGRILGDLKLSQVLSKALEVEEQWKE